MIKSNSLQKDLQIATYYAALHLIALIDYGLSLGIVHYYNRDGRLLTKLDEVIEAVLRKELL